MEDSPLTDDGSETAASDEETASLRTRVTQLEDEKEALHQQVEQRVIAAEMKVEALRAGMIDLDGLKFIDLAPIRLGDDGTLVGGPPLIQHLKAMKPWLFATSSSSSSAAKAPPSKMTRVKNATEMTDVEYKAARAEILRRAAI